MAAEFLIKASKKQNNRKSGAAAAKKLRKRKEAEERQAKYNALSFEQKLTKAVVGSREYKRLLTKQANGK